MKNSFRENKRNLESGLSLMETLVYSALLALFLAGTFMFINNLLATTGDVLERNELVANKEFIDAKLGWLVSQATSVTTPASNISANSLTLTGSQPTIFPAVLTLSNGRLMLSLAGGSASAITNNRVTVTSFSIFHVDTSATLQELRATIDLRSTTRPTITSTGNIFTYILQ